MTYGFGIIGCGKIAPRHAVAIAQLPGARLVGCFDVEPDAARRLSDEYGGRVYGSLEEMLRDAEVQVVTICTPNGNHLEPAVAAADAGKHLLVEKPLEISLSRCDQMIEACRRRQVRLSTIFPLRFYPASARLKRSIEQGQLGTALLACLNSQWSRGEEYYAGWRGTREVAGGGVLMNQAIHGIDLLLWLLGPVAEVSAQVARRGHQRIGVEDTVIASLRFVSGALGCIHGTTAGHTSIRNQVAVYGSRGSVIVEENKIVRWDVLGQGKPARSETALSAGRPGTPGWKSAGHYRQFRDFLTAIHRGCEPGMVELEGRHALELVLAIYEASHTGERVRLLDARIP